jgi:hypothetical protein
MLVTLETLQGFHDLPGIDDLVIEEKGRGEERDGADLAGQSTSRISGIPSSPRRFSHPMLTESVISAGW